MGAFLPKEYQDYQLIILISFGFFLMLVSKITNR